MLKPETIKKLLFTLVISFITTSFKSQERSFISVDYSFSMDSLQGFDEMSVRQNAFNAGCYGSEFKIYMYHAKRNFINEKFSIITNTSSIISKYDNALGTFAAFNEDFEASPTGTITNYTQVAGWIVTSGTNLIPKGSCSLTTGGGCCPSQPYAVQILANGYIDPTIGPKYPIHSVFGSNLNSGDTVSLNAPIGKMRGNRFIKFNDANPNFGVHKLTKKLLVDTSNALFQFAFITVIYPAHECCDAPAFQISIKNLTTSTASMCPSFSFAPGPNCVFSSPNTYYQGGSTNTATLTNGYPVYSPWTLRNIDLRPFTGDSIQIDFVMCDCVYGAHQGLAYLDAQCGPMNVLTNSPSGLPAICLTNGTATMSAVPGFTPYQWSGPGGFTSNSSSVTISTPGNYTLSIGDSCLKTTYVIPVTTKPNVTVTPFYYLCSGAATLNASGAATYTWLPGNANGSSISPSPTITTTYTVEAGSGTCTNSAVSIVSVGVAPPLILTSDVQSGCKGTCVTFSNSSTDFTPFTYNWGDGSSLTPMLTTHCYSVSGNYSVTAQATYSSGCTVISSGVLTVTIFPSPLAGINIIGGSTQPVNAPITFNNITTGANSFSWNFGDSSAVFNTVLPVDAIHSYTSVGQHCVKLTATDTILGCKDSTDSCFGIPCVSEISFPNVFTPNGNNVNEVFSFGNNCIKSLNCVIYDRWGLKVYEWDKVHGGWDGHTVAGVPVSEGTYFFILNYVDAEDKEVRKTGSISLFR